MCDVMMKMAYMEPSIVEEDVMLFVVLLQQLACRVGSLRADPSHIEDGLLRRREVDVRGGSHCASGTCRRGSPKSLYRVKSQRRVPAARCTERVRHVHRSCEHPKKVGTYRYPPAHSKEDYQVRDSRGAGHASDDDSIQVPNTVCGARLGRSQSACPTMTS